MTDFVSPAFLARRYQVTRSAVSNWMVRYVGFCDRHDGFTESCSECQFEWARKLPYPDGFVFRSEDAAGIPVWALSRLPELDDWARHGRIVAVPKEWTLPKKRTSSVWDARRKEEGKETGSE